MEQLALVKPDIQYSEQIKSYRQEFLDNDCSMDGCSSLRRMENPIDWLYQVESLANKGGIQFFYVREIDNKLVAMIQIRLYFNEYLEKFGGNIGYSVRPSERKKGYATKMLHDCLSYCRKIGMEKVLITCIDNNEGSRKTILKNGGLYESTVFEPNEGVNLERYWITL